MGGWTERLEDRLRRRILAGLHRGGLAPDDRLPSMRGLARELGEDHRAVARAYRKLQEEGLVEIRPRSGVYVARQERVGVDMSLLSGTAAWLGRVVYEGWQRGMTPVDLREAVTRAVRPDALRIACVESVEDPLHALAEAVEKVLSAKCERVLLKDEGEAYVPDSVDLIATTAFHSALRRKAEEAGVPLVLLRVNAEWVAALRSWAERSPLLIVVEDSRVRSRFRTLLGSDLPFEFRLADEVRSLAGPPRDAVVYATLLARRSLQGRWAELARVPDASLLDPRTVRDLTAHLVRAGLAG